MLLDAQIVSGVTQVGNNTLLLLWIAIAVVGLVGSALTVLKWSRDKGAADQQLQSRLSAIETKLTPNGLDTNEVGDTVKRTEIAVAALATKLDQHIGAAEEIQKALWCAIDRKQDAA